MAMLAERRDAARQSPQTRRKNRKFSTLLWQSLCQAHHINLDMTLDIAITLSLPVLCAVLEWLLWARCSPTHGRALQLTLNR